jgi:hypothetical protein
MVERTAPADRRDAIFLALELRCWIGDSNKVGVDGERLLPPPPHAASSATLSDGPSKVKRCFIAVTAQMPELPAGSRPGRLSAALYYHHGRKRRCCRFPSRRKRRSLLRKDYLRRQILSHRDCSRLR